MRGPPTDAGSAGCSLRDLDQRGRVIAVAIAALLLALFALSAARTLADGWIPTGDEALLALRAHDVLDGHPPLVGQPSTSRSSGGRATNHPGPIQAWLFSIPVRVLGAAGGMRFGASAVNGVAVLIAAWVVLRRAGPSMAVAASVVLALVVWAQGTDLPSDPLSSNQGAYPALALAFLCWALFGGDLRLAPLTVLVGSFAAQQHLNQVIPALLLIFVATLGATWQVRRRRRATRLQEPAGVRPLLADAQWLLAAGVVGVLSALPVLVQELTGHPGNITSVLRYAGEGDRPTLGVVRGATQVLRASGSPSLLVHHNLTGFEAQSLLMWPGVVAGAVMVVFLGWMVLRDSRRERARLAIVALVLDVAGFFNGTNLLQTEVSRVNQYRWMWIVCAVTWLAIGWWVGERVGPLLARAWPASARSRVPLAIGVVLVFLAAGDAGAFATRTRDDQARFANSLSLVRRLRPAVRAQTRGGGTWIVAITGTFAQNVVAPALVLDLVEHGVDVDIASTEADVHDFYGWQRRHRTGPVKGVLLVRSSLGPAKAAPGALVATRRLNPDLNELIDHVAPTLLGKTVREQPPDKAEQALRSLGFDGLERFFALVQAGRLGTDATTLRYGNVIRGIDRGILVSPQVPRGTVHRMVRLLDRGGEPLLFGDDRVEVRGMTQVQLATVGAFR